MEIKNFVSASNISEFNTALRLEEPERILYLAVPLATYSSFFDLPFTKTVVQENQLKMIIYDVEKENIVAWIN